MRWLDICLQNPHTLYYYMGCGVAANQMQSCLLQKVEYIT